MLLRYLSDVYKAMQQTVPESARTDEVDDLIGWLGRARAPGRLEPASTSGSALTADDPDALRPTRDDEPMDITRDRRGFRALVRSELFRWVQLVARGAYDDLAQLEAGGEPWSVEDLEDVLEPYWDEHDWIGIDAEARSTRYFELDDRGVERWPVMQWLLDPEGTNEWRIDAEVEVERSREEGHAVVLFGGVSQAVE